MHWKIKASIQNIISHLPSSLSYEVYYWVQRHFGGLRQVNPSNTLIAGIKTWKYIQKQGRSPVGKVFLEVGTGRAPIVPLSYWLMGAKRTYTFDINPYLKEELIIEHLQYIAKNANAILELFGSLIDKNRFNDILSFAKKSKISATQFLDLCQIIYIAPGDAAKTTLPEQYIDFHTSYTVFEHIPRNALVHILKEGNRIIKKDGLFVHRIDYSDHFSHSDKEISGINFLQYSDKEWARYASNRYMYMNRLRHDDFLSLFKFVGHRIIDTDTDKNRHSEELLKRGDLHLDNRFSTKSREVLSISASWIITEKN